MLRHDFWQYFDRNGPSQIRIACAIDLAQPTGAQGRQKFVMCDRLRHAWDYFLGGRDGRMSTRLERLRRSCDTRSTTTWATSSGRSFHSLSGSACPVKSVFTDPGLM